VLERGKGRAREGGREEEEGREVLSSGYCHSSIVTYRKDLGKTLAACQGQQHLGEL
jgi:hypothetical protein